MSAHFSSHPPPEAPPQQPQHNFFPKDFDPTKPQIVVVGAGISGVSTAYYLQKQGKDVVIIDSMDDVAQGATKVAVPLLKRYQSPLINYDVYDKIKSNYCPVRMFYKAQKFADTFTHKAFYEAYGWDILNLAFDGPKLAEMTEKLAVLTQSNYSETLNLIADEKLPMNLAGGHLLVGDDKTAMTQPLGDYRKFRLLFKDYDGFKLENDDSSYLFPSLQQERMDHHGGLYTPSSLVFHPTLFTQFLQGRILQKNLERHQNSTKTAITVDSKGNCTTTGDVPPGKVQFLFNTKAVGFTMKSPDHIGSIMLEHRQEVLPTAEELQAKQQELEELNKQREELQHQEGFEQDILPGVNAGQLSDQPKRFMPVGTSECQVDKVVLCNGYQAYQITETLHDEGPLLQIVPVRSLSFDVYDKTRARFEKSVPTFFPTYPTTFYPEDPEFTRVQREWEADRAKFGLQDEPIYPYGFSQLNPQQHPLLNPPKVDPMSVDEIQSTCTTEERMNLNGVASIEFAHNGCTLVQDLHNPRHFYGYLGKDMAQLSDSITDRHMQSIMNVLEAVRKIPNGALVEVDPEADQLKRRTSDRQPRSGRFLSMQPTSMALHTVGRDGLPVIGPSAHVSNLFFNTGHGNAPHNTAIIGAKMVSKMISDPLYGQNVAEVNQQLLLDQMIKENRELAGKVEFTQIPKQFDLKRIFNLIPTVEKIKLQQEAKQDNDTTLVAVKESILPLSFRDFLPARWPLHKFTPYWFQNAQSNQTEIDETRRAAMEKRELKRQQIQQRIAARNAALAQQQGQ